jgi:LCP family protein required for cell wall assembly
MGVDGHSRGGGSGRRYRRLLWALTSLATVMVLGVGAVAGHAWYLNSQIHRLPVKDLTAAPTARAAKGTENILMVGSTSRCALKVQNPAYGLCSEGVTGVNSDVVMILNLATHAVSVLSIPRDLFVPNARQEGANKIDAALYQGPSQLVDAIEEDFGIPIQHLVELDFDTFANVVDALGGIKMYFPEPVYDSYSGLDITSPGCVALGRNSRSTTPSTVQTPFEPSRCSQAAWPSPAWWSWRSRS